MENKTPERRQSESVSLKINNDEKTVNKTFHSRKSLLKTLSKIKKHNAYQKNEYSLEDYHLFTKNDIFYDKVERPNSLNKLILQESNRNYARLNESQNVRSFTSSLKSKIKDKKETDNNKNEGKTYVGNEDFYQPHSLYSNYDNIMKSKELPDKGISTIKKNNNLKSISNSLNDQTQTLNFTEADFIKTTNKKENQNFYLNHSDFLEDNEIELYDNNNRDNYIQKNVLIGNKNSNYIAKSLINKLNEINNINLIIEDASDIPFEEELIQGDEIKSILNSIFMDYAKYNEAENDYSIPFQKIIVIFRNVNIIHEMIFKYNDFTLFLKKIMGKSQKIGFEAFLNIIAKIALKLFDCFSSNPEKCINFLVKSHFEPIFCKGKVELYLDNTLRKTKNGFYPFNSSTSILESKPNLDPNARLNKNNENLTKSKKGLNSKSLPPKTESLNLNREAIKPSNFNLKIDDKNKDNNSNNSSRKIKFGFPLESDLNPTPNNYNNIHSNFDNQIYSQMMEQEKTRASTQLNSNLTSLTYKDLEIFIQNTAIEMKTKILINSITPTLLILYKVYFEHEIKRTFTKMNIVKKSNDSLLSFCKDFLIFPNYLNVNFVINYYNISTSENNVLHHLFKSETFSKEGFFKIQNFENSREVYQGVYFSFYKFCISLIHFGLFCFPKLLTKIESKSIKTKSKLDSTNKNFLNTTKEFLYEEKENADSNHSKNQISNYSASEKILIFLDFLEESKGLKIVEKRLTRVNRAKLTFIPVIEVVNLIKQKNESNKQNESFGSITEDLDESEHELNERKKNDQPDDFKNIHKLDGHNNLKEMKIRDILNPAITHKTFLKLENWLVRLREMFSFYSISYEKINLDKMNFSCFLKFLRDANLICGFTDIGSKNNNNNNNKTAIGLISNLAINKTFENESKEKIFNSRIMGECIVPKKVESVLSFQKYNDKLAQKIRKRSLENRIINNNSNNSNGNKSFLSMNNQISNNNNNLNNSYIREDRKSSNENIKSSLNNVERNQNEPADDNSNNSFLGESIDLSLNNNINANKCNNSQVASEINILLTKNNYNLRQSKVNNTSPNLINNNTNFKNENKSFNDPKGKFNKTFERLNNNEFFGNKIAENEMSIIFQNLVGKKNYDIKKLDKSEKKMSEKEYEEENNFIKENTNIVKNAKMNPQKLNFNMFVKALEIISNKSYRHGTDENTKFKSANKIDKCFEKFIDFNIPIIFDNFVNKYKNHQRIRNSEISINNFLNQIQDEKIASLIRDMQEYVKIFFMNYCDKYGLVSFEKTINFLKDFYIYPTRINLLFIKNLYGHYSELFSLMVNSYRNGAIDFLEIESKGKLEEIKNILENDFNILNDDMVLQEIKNLIIKENKVNLLLFNQILAIVSLKVKADSKFSEFEKVFYLYEKMANCDDTVKKILMRNGNTFNSGLDYNNYLRIIKEKYSDCFNDNINLKDELNEDYIKFSNYFRK